MSLVKCGPLCRRSAVSTTVICTGKQVGLRCSYKSPSEADFTLTVEDMEAASPIKLLRFAFLLVLYLLGTGGITPQKVDARDPACNGSIAECSEEAEFQMDSEINRRLLEQKKYISPGALKKDQPVCGGGGSGNAYTNSGCLPAPSNPQTRGCFKYYRCRSDS
ncbi:hypothetical protein BT93_H1728 [Corymbia citriodora subsp. variegata]|nr:hypothetical protein BT93_H1728 [Corymbia citriodora subsp. variegata]